MGLKTELRFCHLSHRKPMADNEKGVEDREEYQIQIVTKAY